MPPAGITVRAHDDEETATSGCASGAVARVGSRRHGDQSHGQSCQHWGHEPHDPNVIIRLQMPARLRARSRRREKQVRRLASKPIFEAGSQWRSLGSDRLVRGVRVGFRAHLAAARRTRCHRRGTDRARRGSSPQPRRGVPRPARGLHRIQRDRQATLPRNFLGLVFTSPRGTPLDVGPVQVLLDLGGVGQRVPDLGPGRVDDYACDRLEPSRHLSPPLWVIALRRNPSPPLDHATIADEGPILQPLQ